MLQAKLFCLVVPHAQYIQRSGSEETAQRNYLSAKNNISKSQIHCLLIVPLQ